MDAFDERLSSSEGGDPDGFTYQFLSRKGHEFFCEIDEDYILDRFNLTGIAVEVQNYQMALEMVTDTFSERTDIKEEWRSTIEENARHLYGLIHARFIITPRGLSKMVEVPELHRGAKADVNKAEKFNTADFGRCPRVFCSGQPLLPVGMSDVCGFSSVQLYCAHCEDVYTPKSLRHAQIVSGWIHPVTPY